MGRIRHKTREIAVGDRLLLWATGVLCTGVLCTGKLLGGRNDDHTPVFSWNQQKAEGTLWRYRQRAIATSCCTKPTAALATGPSKPSKLNVES